ncbi:hypothetical protein [Melghiribacillus thermohalophilus]|nr:hypothetical protein [Melghiribacillus thermohalophilus]
MSIVECFEQFRQNAIHDAELSFALLQVILQGYVQLNEDEVS